MAVLPLMLFAARHVRRDIPAALAWALAGHPEIETHQGVHLGCHPRVVELSRKRYWESLSGRAAVPSEQTLLLLVGRGARDPDALREMRHFAELRQREDAIDRIEVCSASMAEPSLEAMLGRVVHQPIRRTVVQPHLLFPGRLLARISATVGDTRKPVRLWIG